MFSFQPRWKEELIVSVADGSFMLELAGSPLIAALPTEERWRERVPTWAKELWPQLHLELAAWCQENNVTLAVEATAQVY